MPYSLSLSLCSIFPINQSIKIVVINLPSHNHQPQKEDHSRDLQPKCRPPATTYIVLRQPRECVDTDARKLLQILAIAVDVATGAVELDGGFDQAGEPEDEEDKGPQYDGARYQVTLGGETQDDEEEEKGESADYYHEWHDPTQTIQLASNRSTTRQEPKEKRNVPWYPEFHRSLYTHKPSKHPQNTGRDAQYEKDPYV